MVSIIITKYAKKLDKLFTDCKIGKLHINSSLPKNASNRFYSPHLISNLKHPLIYISRQGGVNIPCNTTMSKQHYYVTFQ